MSDESYENHSSPSEYHKTAHPTKVLTPADMHPDENPADWDEERKLKEEADHRERKDRHYDKLVEEVHNLSQDLYERSRNPITGLLGKKEFLIRTAEEFKRQKRYGGNATMLAIDLDKFKIANDTYGHAAGDEVLRTVGRVLGTLRQTDVLAHPGGDEFFVILIDKQKDPNNKDEGKTDNTMTIAERLLRGIQNSVTKYGNNEIKVGATIGVATLDNVSSAEEWIDKADKALYYGKNVGKVIDETTGKRQKKNCVVTLDNLEPANIKKLDSERGLNLSAALR